MLENHIATPEVTCEAPFTIPGESVEAENAAKRLARARRVGKGAVRLDSNLALIEPLVSDAPATPEYPTREAYYSRLARRSVDTYAWSAA